MDINKIAELLKVNIPEEKVLINEPMSKHTSFKIGGPADIFVKTSDISQIENVLKVCRENSIPLTVVGNGSNLLVKDKGIRGIVLKNCMNKYRIEKNDEGAEVYVDAGVLNAVLAQALMKEGLTGFEFAAGIPGTVGGAIFMNAGAYGGEIKDIIEETTFVDLEDENKIKTISKQEQDFAYRHSIFENSKAIIIGAKFKLNNGNIDDIKEKMNANLLSRRDKQPIENPSAGSTFKRGDGFITAKIIDECGLKGISIGDAKVSEKHAGFVVNTGNATAKDVICLIKKIKAEVYKKTGKQIETEIKIIGE
jgi:UDP-N-acetylmuramate dehydrogenase